VRALVRMLLAGLGTWAVMAVVQHVLSDHLALSHKVAALLDIAAVGCLGLVTYLALARLMRIREVTEMVAMVRRRLPLGG